MKWIGTTVIACLLVLGGCGGSSDESEPATKPTEAKSAAPVDWQTACPALQAALDESLSDAVITPSSEWNALADAVGRILNGLAPEPQLEAVEQTSRAAAVNADDPNAGPDENLKARGDWYDAMDVVTDRCRSEGAPLS